jgi:mannose-1-phosphate guanylyltransferase
MFIWRADRLMEEFAIQLPESYGAFRRIAAALDTADARRVLETEWPQVQKISIDYGIMERATRVSVIPVEFGWSDIGNWASLLDVLPDDGQGNVIIGEAVLTDTRNCLLRSGGRLIAAIGVEDLVIVETPDVVLVCPRDRAQDVRDVVNRLAAQGKPQYL